MPTTPGYSGKTIAQKLGIKPGMRVRVTGYDGDWSELTGPVDVVPANTELALQHLFVTRLDALVTGLASAMADMAQGGMIWVSWPKKSAGVPTEVSEDTIRAVALPMGLVDIKVCAVTEVWSGLKLTRRRA